MAFLSIVIRPQVHDIEDLAKVGKDHKACPYYAATHFAGAVFIEHIKPWRVSSQEMHALQAFALQAVLRKLKALT